MTTARINVTFQVGFEWHDDITWGLLRRVVAEVPASPHDQVITRAKELVTTYALSREAGLDQEVAVRIVSAVDAYEQPCELCGRLVGRWAVDEHMLRFGGRTGHHTCVEAETERLGDLEGDLIASGRR